MMKIGEHLNSLIFTIIRIPKIFVKIRIFVPWRIFGYSRIFEYRKYSSRFENLVNNLKFDKISLKQNVSDAADLILNDHKHIDNNPRPVKKEDIIKILENINSI